MSDRRDLDADRTDRPDALLTVADVLALPALAEGLPEVVVGGSALHASVRWVHASDSAGVARLLDGGELLLSTGAGWPDAPSAQRAFVRELGAVPIAGVIIELGAAHVHVPEAISETCAELGLALIALRREIKFVAITEAVHRSLIAAQTEALGERQRLHELFTALSLRGAPADVVVGETARALGSPVVLENLAGEVVVEESLRTPVADVLAGRTASGVERVPVEARGVRWGALVALDGPAHPAGRRTVLELGATALAFGCLAEGGEAEWALLAQRSVIDDLLGARFATPRDMGARLEAAGFPLDGRQCHGLVLRGRAEDGRTVAEARRARGAVIATRRGVDEMALVSLPASVELTDRLAAQLAGPERAVFIGPAVADVLGLLSSLRAAQELAHASSADGDAPRVRRVDDHPLGRLVSSLRDDRRLHEHSERMLAPLVAYDAERRGDLLSVLAALVAHPGNRSAAAAASHLSRSVFYQRLTLIGDLLDADLDDGETLAALHLALLARRGQGRVPQL